MALETNQHAGSCSRLRFVTMTGSALFVRYRTCRHRGSTE